MDKWEYYRALLLEIRIKKIGLPAASHLQLKNILELQFQEDCYTEITGSIFKRKDEIMSLEFEVIRPPEITMVENALKKFRQRDFSQISLLAKYITQEKENIEKYHGKNRDLTMAAAIFDATAVNPAALEKLSDKTLERYFNLYRFFLESNTAAWGKDYKVDHKDFLSIFHCHNNGSTPSPIDLASNASSGIPNVVISAKADFLQSGLALYLIFGGDYETLYKGPLQLAKK